VFATMMALFAEIERDLISARTKEVLKAGKATGAKLGRPKGPRKSKLDQYLPEIEALLKKGSKQSYIAKRYGSSKVNLHNWLKKNIIDRTISVFSALGLHLCGAAGPAWWGSKMLPSLNYHLHLNLRFL